MKRFAITIILLLSAAFANYTLSKPEAKIPRTPLKDFPRVIGDWKAVADHPIDDASMAVLLVDDYIMRTYVNTKGEAIGLYIGYFETQREGKQVHSPRQCLPGAGWDIAEHKIYPLKLASHNPAEVPINFHLMQKGDHKQLYLWWYNARGRVYANEYLNKLYMIWDAVTMRRTDGALVRFNMAVKIDPAETLNEQLGFVNLVTPILSNYLPS